MRAGLCVRCAVCVRVEEAIEGTEGIDRITSQASEGLCSVNVELVSGVDKTKTANDIKSNTRAVPATILTHQQHDPEVLGGEMPTYRKKRGGGCAVS